MAHDGPEYLTLQQSVEVEPFPDPADDDEEEDVRAFLSFIPLLRFQTDKLFGAVALPVFYCAAMTLLLMNVLTFVLPVCGVRLVLVSGDLDRAMAGTWATVLATALNLLVLYWYGRLREHVETLVSEGLATKLRRCICGTADSPAAGTTGRKSPPEQRLSSASLRPLASARSAPAAREEKLSRTASASVDVHPPADVYISHGEDPDDMRTAKALKKTAGEFPTPASAWFSAEIVNGREHATEAWLIESHIAEAVAASKIFVALISEASLRSVARAHEEWSLTLAEWDTALQLHNKGALSIVPAWIGDAEPGLVRQRTYSDQPPKGGKPTVNGEELFDSLSLRQRSVGAIVAEMLSLAESSLRVHSAITNTVDGEQPKSLMISYRVTETGDPEDTKDESLQGDNFTVSSGFSTATARS